jgi:sulfonate transport system permease protein
MRVSSSTDLLTRRPVRFIVGLIGPALVLAWWQWEAGRGGAHAAAFASLGTIGGAAQELIANGSLVADAEATLRRAFIGLGVGATLGIVLGVAMGASRLLDRLLSPLLNALRQVPMIGWLPLIGLWFGAGDISQLIVIAFSAFFPALLNAHAGVTQVEMRYLDVADVLQFSPWQRFAHVLVPSAMPLILTGLVQALAFAWIAAIGTEILMGSGGGLGATMQLGQTQQRLDIILVAIIATAALGFGVNQSVLWLRRRVLRWHVAAR